MRYPITAVVILVMLPSVWAGEAKSYVAAGATTVQPIIQQCARQYKQNHPDIDFAVGAGGSDHGVETVGTGKVQLGLVGRGLKDAEKQKYPDLQSTTIGLDGIALVVNSSNPVRKLTRQQLQDMYSGKIKNWKEVGGADAPVALSSRTKGHAQLDLLLSFAGLEVTFDESGENAIHGVKGGEKGTVKAQTAINNDKMMEQVVTNPNALTYLPIGFAQTKITRGAPLALIELDGIAPTAANVVNATYPLRRPLLVVTKGAPEPAMKEFIDFLISDAGQKIVLALDYIPVPKAEPKP